MTDNWTTCKLREVADVRVSNVDKKIHNAETPIKLCNYMDVYANDYVTESINFMSASASKLEIDRFGLQAGDVVITKDSETPDDIGVSAVVTDSIDGLICGYHLALVRPRNGAIDPIYLAKQFSSDPVARYFTLNAGGSTRFGLPVGVIENTQIPVAPRLEQTKIAEILSTVDQAIDQTEALITKQQRIKTGLMQDLLTRGIDKEGNLRSEDTHEFKDSPLGRIPVEWEMRRLEELAVKVVDGVHRTPTYIDSGIPFIVVTDLTKGLGICFSNTRFISEKDHREFIKRADPRAGDILVTKDGTLGVARIVDNNAPPFSIFVSVAMLRPRVELCLPELIWSFFESHQFLRQLGALSAGTGLAHIHLEHFRKFLIRQPPFQEQCMIFKVITEHGLLLQREFLRFAKLKRQKAALMQDLLTGEVPITPLLTGEEFDV